jgi:DNA-binding IclR family transcriptional regulator
MKAGTAQGGVVKKQDQASREEKTEARYNVPALEKGLEILELLARSSAPLNLTSISAELGRSTGEIYRILQYLDHSAYIVRDDDSDTYSLSMKMFHLSHDNPPVRSLSAAAVPIMEDLAASTGHSCHLAVLNRTSVTIVVTITSPLPIIYTVRLGAQFPVWETSSGILLCAFQRDAAERALFANLAQIIDDEAIAVLRGKMAQVTQAGFEERASMRIPGIINISFPVRDRLGNVVAALTVPYLPQRTSFTTLEEVRDLASRASSNLSRVLGFRETVVE